MKNTLLIFAISLLPLLSSAQTQKLVRNTDYISLFNNTEYLAVFAITFEGAIPEKFYQDGDTIVDGKKYYRVVTEIVEVDIPGISLYYYLYPRVTSVDYYREDPETKQVWWTHLETGQEFLIFDFGLKVGDTMPTDTNLILSKIDTIAINGQDRRRFTFKHTFDDGYQAIWADGIGNLSSGFSPRGKDTPPEQIPGVLCFSQNGQLIYNERAIARGLPEDICGTYITVPTKNLPLLDPAMQVFPNPGTTSIRVQSDLLKQTPVRWDIRDMLGRVVLSQSQKEMINGQPINIEKLDVGIYSITIYTDGKRQTLRFVKQ